MSEEGPEITLYTRPWCGSVLRVKHFLDERGIPYAEIDITRDAEAARLVRSLNQGNESVPTVLINGRYAATEPTAAELTRLLGLAE